MVQSSGVAYAPEQCPFETVIVDVTHRCNMNCRNCYIPNRDVPDLNRDWLKQILARLPKHRLIRLVGAEPTVRQDLPELIQDIRRNGHHAVLLTNGLRLADLVYVRELKRAGIGIVYLSFNGGFDDDLYEAIDSLRCAQKKVAALQNLCTERIFTTLGTILVRGINEHALGCVLDFCMKHRNVLELHLRSVGAIGRYMETLPFSLSELLEVFCGAACVESRSITLAERSPTSADFRFGAHLRVQLTQWPDLGNQFRGRLTPEGMIEPFFEHVLANEGGY
jgi:molybdenum cofactor biosynthesis enzyme MoaA